MKIILGDNQFFGINHSDLKKGESIKLKFEEKNSIVDFIKASISIGLDGFMINSNEKGYDIIKSYTKVKNEEIHYSIPYPHKYASIVNENGMFSLLSYFLKNTNFLSVLINFPMFIFSRNIKYLMPIALSLEIPKSLPKGSVVYLQNIISDLIIGLKRFDLFEKFVTQVRKMGYAPGIISLNPVILHSIIIKSKILNQEDLVVCFNINKVGFNVFPSVDKVEEVVNSEKKYKIMAMSIFASGVSEIEASINYISKLPLDYVVFGTSKIKNVESNFNRLKSFKSS